MSKKTLFKLILLVFHNASLGLSIRAETPDQSEDLTYVVVARDRGFLGNLTVEDRFADYQKHYPRSQLFFSTRRLQRERLGSLISDLAKQGTKRTVILPATISEREKWWKEFRADLSDVLEKENHSIRIDFSEPFGASYLVSEILLELIEGVSTRPEEEHLTVLGWGATSPETEEAIRDKLDHLLQPLLPRFHFASWDIEVLWSDLDDPNATQRNNELFERISERSAQGHRSILVPFYLGYRADSHMSVEAFVQSELDSQPITWSTAMPDEHALFALWMTRSSARFAPAVPENIGVVLLSHGSDRIWNEEIQEALEPVTRKYETVFSFNMGDPRLLQRAVSELEARGKKIIIIYRLFSMESSFADSIRRMIGSQEDQMHEAGHHGGHGSGYQRRIHTGSHLVTFGGLEDHPLFAEALLERAMEISGGNTQEETVLLVAHGTGSDQANQHWKRVLGSLAKEMQQKAKTPFHKIIGATLREDWPDQREEALKEIEEIVKEARREGKRVIAVEARINGPGPTQGLLRDLEVPVNDEGFVPHPNISRIVLDRIEQFIRNRHN